MRVILVCACILMMSSGCGLKNLVTREPSSSPPTTARVVRESKTDPFTCDVSDAPVPSEALAANAADGVTEELGIYDVADQLAARLKAFWKCAERHNRKAEKNGRTDPE